ncbi:MAG: acetyl-CoA carboxylase, biotin carboxyl carrier protein, partial [Dictyoglomus sp.]
MKDWTLEELKEIINLFTKSNLSELVLENGESKLVLRKSDNVVNIVSQERPSIVEKEIEVETKKKED